MNSISGSFRVSKRNHQSGISEYTNDEARLHEKDLIHSEFFCSKDQSRVTLKKLNSWSSCTIKQPRIIPSLFRQFLVAIRNLVNMVKVTSPLIIEFMDISFDVWLVAGCLCHTNGWEDNGSDFSSSLPPSTSAWFLCVVATYGSLIMMIMQNFHLSIESGSLQNTQSADPITDEADDGGVEGEYQLGEEYGLGPRGSLAEAINTFINLLSMQLCESAKRSSVVTKLAACHSRVTYLKHAIALGEALSIAILVYFVYYDCEKQAKKPLLIRSLEPVRIFENSNDISASWLAYGP
ncbi:hypothetical protein VNO77_34277 [Canavalia gladiata]|uniref:Uncharacterized protein n=1 Tax=Canavalia gladiata TaxID=3824 RepID=A0AAN9PZN1_CANGL